MHELGIVFHCIKQINELATENNAKRIASVTIEIGEVSTVVPYYFEDVWKWAVNKDETAPVYGAKLVIEQIKAVTHCEGCGCDYPTVEHGKICPHCNSDNTYLLTGNEVLIKEIAAYD